MGSEVGFRNWLLLRGLSRVTISKHIKNLSVLTRDCGEINLETFTNFIVRKKLSGARNGTLDWYITTAKHYVEFTNGDKRVLKFKYFPDQQFAKQTFSDSEIEAFIDLPQQKHSPTLMYKKWKLFWKLLAYSGMRPHELGQMTASRCDLGREVFMVENTKTGVPRNVPIPPNCLQELKDFLVNLQGENLFVTGRGQVFSYRSWSHDFEWRIKALGIKRKNLTPYSFRHSAATRWLEADINIHKIAKILGHDITMTAKYEHLTTQDIKNAIRKDPLVKKACSPAEILGGIAEYVKNTLHGDNRFTLSCEEGTNFLNFRICAGQALKSSHPF